MSTHKIEVLKVEEIRKHENADALEIVPIWGYQCITRKGQFSVGDLVAYVEPDYMVDVNRPEFCFLDTHPENKQPEKLVRIRAKKLRGVWSQGLLIPAPTGTALGDNVMEILGVKRYEPSIARYSLKGADAEPGPDLNFQVSKYDLENYKKYHRLFKDDDMVIYSTKIHGSSARYVWYNERMYCGSRTLWRKEGESSPWWSALRDNPWIEEWCKSNPGIVLYGEIFGPSIQGTKFHYGIPNDKVGFLCFDILENGMWRDNEWMLSPGIIKTVPILFTGTHNPKLLEELAEQKETLNNCNHIREGVVVKLLQERHEVSLNHSLRLKYVSNTYLEKS